MDRRERQRGHGQLRPLAGGVRHDGADYGVVEPSFQVPDPQRTESTVPI